MHTSGGCVNFLLNSIKKSSVSLKVCSYAEFKTVIPPCVGMWEFCAGWWIPRLFKAYQLKLIESFWHGKHTATWRMIDKITTNFISKSGGSAQAPLIINLSNNLLRFFKKSTTKLSHAIGQRSSETKLPINFNWKKNSRQSNSANRIGILMKIFANCYERIWMWSKLWKNLLTF